jgi:phosphatidylglycerophosphatase A
MASVAAFSPARLLATFFGCGYSPAAPGTAGSAAAIALAIVAERWVNLPPWSFAAAAVVIAGPAIWSAGATARETGAEDPSIVVIDEVVGQWISLAGANHLNWKSYLAAFLLFRLFDIWKPPPVRNLEALAGGWGIVADDAMAGVYAAAVLWLSGYLGWY